MKTLPCDELAGLFALLQAILKWYIQSEKRII